MDPTVQKAGVWMALFGFFLLFGSLACAGGQPALPADISEIDLEAFQDGAFGTMIPSWDPIEVEDETTLTAVARGNHSFLIGRHEHVPRMVGSHFARVLPDFGDFRQITLSDSKPDGVVVDAESTDGARWLTTFLYCDGASYQLTASAPAEGFEPMQSLYDHVLKSVVCESVVEPPSLENGMIGLVIMPANSDFEFPNYRAAITQARQAGVETAHMYIDWGGIETDPQQYDWTLSDLLLDPLVLEGMRLSLVIEFIHTSVPGGAPEDLLDRSWNDTEFVNRATLFSAAFAERYQSQLDYLALGNEVNIYFGQHPDQLNSYLEAFEAIKLGVREAAPGLPVGTVLAYHTAVENGQQDVIDAFKIGDFLAYTYYPHNPGFRYDVPTDSFGPVLDGMISASGETPFIIVENGFSSAQSLGSDEGRQAAYVRETFEALAAKQEAFGRHIWFGYHDGDDCEEAALSFFDEDFEPDSIDGSTWTAFEDYLCTLGLRQFDGTQKEGWQAFEESLSIYDSEIQP